MKYCYVVMTMLFFSLHTAKSQGLSRERKATVESFITALFRDNESPKFIIDNYMYFPLNDSVPSKERETMISTLIDTLKKTHSGVVSSPGYKIISYDEFKGEKKMFADPTHDIGILTVHNKPVIYFYFHEDRIFSFTIMEKGKYGYFLTI